MKTLRALLAGLVLTGGWCAVSAADWQLAEVPGEREINGYSWYRAWLKPHATFFSRHDRDLWGNP